mgnify:FL=1|tara:strand:+ start:1548 stop:1841 length:294 start_codon:yes stop_codon:yes gene_type:complete
MQGNLFYPSVPGWQKTDTSKTAAKEIAPTAKTVRALVLHQLKDRSLTTYELAERLGLPYHTVQPRTSELRATNQIVDSGDRRMNPTGKQGIVWIAHG